VNQQSFAAENILSQQCIAGEGLKTNSPPWSIAVQIPVSRVNDAGTNVITCRRVTGMRERTERRMLRHRFAFDGRRSTTEGMKFLLRLALDLYSDPPRMISIPWQ
jgi:hypothetical protein